MYYSWRHIYMFKTNPLSISSKVPYFWRITCIVIRNLFSLNYYWPKNSDNPILKQFQSLQRISKLFSISPTRSNKQVALAQTKARIWSISKKSATLCRKGISKNMWKVNKKTTRKKKKHLEGVFRGRLSSKEVSSSLWCRFDDISPASPTSQTSNLRFNRCTSEIPTIDSQNSKGYGYQKQQQDCFPVVTRKHTCGGTANSQHFQIETSIYNYRCKQCILM